MRRVTVKVADNVYQMTRTEFAGLLKIAGEQVPLGVYGIEKNGYAELCNMRCESITQAKQVRRDLKQRGFRVYANIKQ